MIFNVKEVHHQCIWSCCEYGRQSHQIFLSNHHLMLCTPGCCFVSVSLPWGDEGSHMAVIWVEGNTMVAIPAVEDSPLSPTRYGTCLIKWALRVVGFSHGIEVEQLKIHCLPFLGHITMRWHHVTGSPSGTGSRVPTETSWSRPAFTLVCQWSGTAMGVWWTKGLAFGIYHQFHRDTCHEW